MNYTQVLENEHANIKRMLEILRIINLNYLNGLDYDTDELIEISNFISEYADKHHHGKEEAVLFRHMLDELGEVAKSLIQVGMLVEHDLGRYYNRSFKEAIANYKNDRSKENGLAILTYSLAYRDLLTRHIDKENTAVYPFANRALKDETKELVEEESIKFEETYGMDAAKYLQLLEILEEKYIK